MAENSKDAYDIEQDEKNKPITQKQFDFLVESIGRINERLDDVIDKTNQDNNYSRANLGVLYEGLW